MKDINEMNKAERESYFTAVKVCDSRNKANIFCPITNAPCKTGSMKCACFRPSTVKEKFCVECSVDIPAYTYWATYATCMHRDINNEIKHD